MISGVWTSADFRANSQAATFMGKEISNRPPLLTAIEAALDQLHEQAQEHALLNLHFVEDACKAWITGHPQASATPVKGMKTSSRMRAIVALQSQMKVKRESLYLISPEDRQARELITAQYETSTQVLGIAPGNQDPRLDKGRAAFHQELLQATIDRARRLGHADDDLNTEQLGFLAAKAALKIDGVIDPKNHARCRVEAMRILCAMLTKNRALIQQFNGTGIEVVVVPANRPMTDLPEFATLKGVKISQEGGSPRTWDPTRGVGGLTVNTDSGQKLYVAITEENLLGTQVSAEVSAIGGGCYEARYSTTSHEFAHGLHISSAMTPAQKATIARCFAARKRARIDAATSCIIIEDHSLIPTPLALHQVFTEEWADGPRMRAVPLPAPKSYHVYKGAAYVMQPGGGAYLQYTTTYELQDCYSAFDEREYFAQLVNAYLGANGGTDPYTRRPRNNGDAWVRANENRDMVNLLDELFSAGTHSYFGQSRLDDTNVQDDGSDVTTVGDFIRA